MRPEVNELVALGILPSEANAEVSLVEKYQRVLSSIVPPLTDDEACALTRVFGEDDCFGLSWTLVHLIETAPSWPIGECLVDSDNEWVEQLRSRAEG